MNGAEFLRKLKRKAKAEGVSVQVEKHHGKGSHVTVYYGDRLTTLKDRRKEIGAGLLAAMMRQLGIDEL